MQKIIKFEDSRLETIKTVPSRTLVSQYLMRLISSKYADKSLYEHEFAYDSLLVRNKKTKDCILYFTQYCF